MRRPPALSHGTPKSEPIMQIVTNQLFSTIAALTISTMLFVTVLV